MKICEASDWEYIYDERIAILLAGEKREPTADEHKQAIKEADEYESVRMAYGIQVT